jgi:hypothetical protein
MQPRPIQAIDQRRELRGGEPGEPPGAPARHRAYLIKFEIHFIKFGSQQLLIAREKGGGVELRRLAAKPSAFVHASF